jgi:hypothetical protein
MKELRKSEIILLKIAHLSIHKMSFIHNRKIWDAFQLGRDYEKAVKDEQGNNNG